MLNDTFRLALLTHCKGDAESPLYLALREYFDRPERGVLRGIARRHGVRESTLRMSVKSFRDKMELALVTG